ncbi:MAG: tRNA (N(6)-L-threonylcarbamoyladenosine(37)-C(2))-methylthiotransferase MtaB [Flexistipes sinusarabici]|uniref:tRNA (N(6)-L-threonylcarbamoyladenosine(37)-C(2))-methylthiotransferase MtaB n=1 Tax=Flexistipes sinusarabici TaxID=2352 RepID=A0A5D0MPD3_FLESI|nr:tRNA (N(6)-L-threonylcarbamoyladenosine(37)-C(2))-methylthiotransferase MtaB [Flexistipes sinusarabici]TYB33380.1 MAG: tRNA (N(6)-L-threonylcarbamoyladenosine(37)-C(2))-methylthiotransferase MtaB [Flexistipes sinusarabici]
MNTKVQYDKITKRIFFYTFGCKVNQVEIDNLKKKALNAGYAISEDLNNADIVVINSCTVTDKADKKYHSLIRKIKRNYPDIIIITTGCLPEIEKNLENSDIIVPNEQKENLFHYINTEGSDKNADNSLMNDIHAVGSPGKTRAFIKIQDGCNSYCSYCIIPFARGNLKSRDLQSIKAEFEEKLREGYKEMVLVGIHIGNYGKDTDVRFSELVEELVNLSGDFRIRLSSIEVSEVDDKLIELFENYPRKICRHFHIPIQSATDKILSLMNRNYTVNEFSQTINKIRSRLGDINIGTDVIVGFPSETKEDFDHTVDNLYRMNFGYIHVFPYSERKGTKAAEMKAVVPPKTRKERAKFLRDVSENLKFSYSKKYFGQKVRVLVESDGKGLTDSYLTVNLLNHAEKNTFVHAHIVGVNIDGSLMGQVIDEQ